MTRAAINNTVWVVSQVLQCGLLAVVVARGIARRLPCFTVLLGFYPLRAAVLFFGFGHIATDTYASVYEWLAVVGLLLQLVVAGEIGYRLLVALGRRWAWKIGLIPVVAWLVTIVLWQMLPARSPVPPDRLEMFCSITMILLCERVIAERVTGLLRTIAVGFAVYGVVDLIAGAGKSVAAVHRDSAGFTMWSYASSLVYAGVVVFWILRLMGRSGQALSGGGAG